MTTLIKTQAEAARDGLLAIAEAIETKGHYQGQVYTEDGDSPACLVVRTDVPDYDESAALNALHNHLFLGQDTHGRNSRLYRWNDSTPTETVLATLREVAAK